MKVVHDPDKCSGHGRCYVLVPDLFEDDDRGFGVVRGDGELRPDQIDAARKAVVACPEQAISIAD